MSGRIRWKAAYEVPLTRDQIWFLKALCDQSRAAVPDGVAYPARMLVDEVVSKLQRALEPRTR